MISNLLGLWPLGEARAGTVAQRCQCFTSAGLVRVIGFPDASAPMTPV
jgi:hypothetical protein